LTPTAIAVLVAFVGVPLNWYVTWRLWRLSLANPGLQVLRERALVALALTALVTVFALIFVNNDLVPPVISFDDTKWATRGVMLVAAVVPPCYWLWIYRNE
jgi:hypothetical protein